MTKKEERLLEINAKKKGNIKGVTLYFSSIKEAQIANPQYDEFRVVGYAD